MTARNPDGVGVRDKDTPTSRVRSGVHGAKARDPRLAQVRRVSVVDELVEQMTRNIISGEWASGTTLPSLRELAAETGVSMLTVREAIRTLQARGWVETRHGVGTSVLPLNEGEQFVPWILGASDVAEYLELVEAGEVVESSIVDLAARRRTDEQVDRLAEAVGRMADGRRDRDRFLEADAEFHIMLAEAAHNRILLRSMLAIRGPMRLLVANRLLQHLETHGDLDQPVEDHRQILEAVRDGDASRGRPALARIADRSRSHLDVLRVEES